MVLNVSVHFLGGLSVKPSKLIGLDRPSGNLSGEWKTAHCGQRDSGYKMIRHGRTVESRQRANYRQPLTLSQTTNCRLFHTERVCR